MTKGKNRRPAYVKMLKEYPDLLSIEQVCEILGGISTKTGYKMLKEKKIDSLKVGRCYRITKINMIDFLMNTPQ